MNRSYILAAGGTLALLALSGPAEAARWCATIDGAAMRCGFHSSAQCHRATGRGVACLPERAVRGANRNATARAPLMLEPNRPYWAAPNSCWIDEGYGRFSPCDSGNAGGGGGQN